ncbi:hypothetical protein KC930_04110 [Candidatus Saccharibacteria bacterium]|nr:hypothetical protein [Candidatus Saccharibacteria bacterium]
MLREIDKSDSEVKEQLPPTNHAGTFDVLTYDGEIVPEPTEPTPDDTSESIVGDPDLISAEQMRFIALGRLARTAKLLVPNRLGRKQLIKQIDVKDSDILGLSDDQLKLLVQDKVSEIRNSEREDDNPRRR